MALPQPPRASVVRVVAAAFAVTVAAACASSSPSTVLGADAGPSVACSATEKVCTGVCTDVVHDPTNCGGCGTACKTGEVCSAGACAGSCGTGSTQCGASCVDTSSDNANCGACGTKCAAGESCSAGACSAACATGSTLCGSTCVDTTNDAANCGSCGMACSAGESCTAGKCAPGCGSATFCAGADAGYCAETASDNANCGACGNVCTSGTVCEGGSCKTTTRALTCGDAGASTLCKPDGGAPYCADTETDNGNCGACGTVCGAGTACLAGACAASCGGDGGATETLCKTDGAAAYCADTKTDNGNCGACGTVCGAGTVCAAGKCANACAAIDGGVETLCTPAQAPVYCANTQSDNDNCGGCGNTCSPGNTCAAGVCTACATVLFISTSATAPAGVIAGILAAETGICAIDYYDANNGTPNLQLVSPYTAVLLANEQAATYSDPTGLGNLMAAYFNGGGQVVTALFADGGYGIGGTFATADLLITPVNVPDDADSFSSAVATQDLVPTSAVLAGVKSITGTGWHGTQVVQNGGAAVAKWASGELLAVTGVITDTNGHKRNRVDLNILPSDIGSGGWTGNGFQLLANALLYK